MARRVPPEVPLWRARAAPTGHPVVPDQREGRGALGGGVYVAGGQLTLINTTIADNEVAAGGIGGGLDAQGGTVTLANTIIALDASGSGNASTPDDIAGTVSVASAHNLIGIGGSGGLVNGVNGNLVGVADPGLSPLGSYGGPTQTIALLPGSPAIGAGSDDIPGVTVPSTDQRGVSRPSASIDIGAFQDRGFRITIVAGSTPQSTTVNMAFPNPLAVVVISPSGDPVAGGVVTFTLMPAGDGASATLGASTATIGADGQASVTAVANGISGRYDVTASAAGARRPATFTLTNRPAAAGSTTVGVGTDLHGSGILPATTTVGRATTSAAGNVSTSISIGAIPGPVTVPVGIGTNSPASPRHGRAGGAPADRSVPRAEVRLSGRGRPWGLGLTTKPKVIGLA